MELIGEELYAFAAAAVHGSYVGPCDQDTVSAERQCLEYIHARADTAVNENHHAACNSCRNLLKDLGGCRRLILYTAAVVGDNNGGGTCLQCVQSTLYGHDSLDDKRLACLLDDLAQLLYRLAAGRRRKSLQERKACGIHVHSDGKAIGFLNQTEFLLKCIDIPGLDGGNAGTVIVADGCGGCLYNARIGSVAGESNNAGLGTGRNQNVIVFHVGEFLAVVELYCTHRSCHYRQGELLAEK